MLFSSRHEGPFVIFAVQGPFTLGPMLHRVRPRILASLADRPSSGLVINLAGVPEIDSAGLGELVSIHTAVMQLGLRMVLAHVAPRIEQMFKITRLDGVFTAFDTERSALEYLSKSQVPNQP